MSSGSGTPTKRDSFEEFRFRLVDGYAERLIAGTSVAINGIWALPGASRRAPTGLAFATTLDHRLHLFADGAGTFHRIRAH